MTHRHVTNDASPPCECKHEKHAHDNRRPEQRPGGRQGRRCLAFDSYGCPCRCPGYDPVPDEDSIELDDDCVSAGELNELDDICRGRPLLQGGHRITTSPDIDQEDE